MVTGDSQEEVIIFRDPQTAPIIYKSLSCQCLGSMIDDKNKIRVVVQARGHNECIFYHNKIVTITCLSSSSSRKQSTERNCHKKSKQGQKNIKLQSHHFASLVLQQPPFKFSFSGLSLMPEYSTVNDTPSLLTLSIMRCHLQKYMYLQYM